MSSPLRTFLVYFACVAVLLGAMGFVTRRALDLEERERAARGRAALQERIRLALWRMDSTMTAVLARESARPYFHYMPFFPAGAPAETGPAPMLSPAPLVASPLLTAPSEFVKLYFQVSPEGQITSPQVPEGGQRGLAIMTDADSTALDRATDDLHMLTSLVESRGLENVLGIVLAHDRDTGSAAMDHSVPRSLADAATPAPAPPANAAQIASERPASPQTEAPAQQLSPPPQSWDDLQQRQNAVNLATGKDNRAQNEKYTRADGNREPRAVPPPAAAPAGMAPPGAPGRSRPEEDRAGQKAETGSGGNPAPDSGGTKKDATDNPAPAKSAKHADAMDDGAALTALLRAAQVGRDQMPPIQTSDETGSLSAYCVNVLAPEPLSKSVPLAAASATRDGIASSAETTSGMSGSPSPADPERKRQYDAGSRLVPQLFLVREVTLGGVRTLQGAWLDWPILRGQLLNSIGDLLPGASLEPIPSPGIWDGSQIIPTLAGEPPVSGESLASIPARLVVPPATAYALLPPATPLFSATRVAIIVGWLAILAAAVAIGIVLRTAVQLIERRGRFVSAVTHELRTPLTTFCLYSQMLADGMVSDEDARREYHRTLRSEADRLSRIVESVLDYARLGKRKSGAIWPLFGASELLSRISVPAAARAAACGLELVVEDLGLQSTHVRVDPAAIERIVQNLVDNACKYAADATDRRLLLRGRRDGARVVISVTDHGPGIPTQERRRVFRPFQRGKAQSDGAKPGLGLGLAFARGLARDMGGDLVLTKPQPPTGATFELRLRAAPDDETSPQDSTHTEP